MGRTAMPPSADSASVVMAASPVGDDIADRDQRCETDEPQLRAQAKLLAGQALVPCILVFARQARLFPVVVFQIHVATPLSGLEAPGGKPGVTNLLHEQALPSLGRALDMHDSHPAESGFRPVVKKRVC